MSYPKNETLLLLAVGYSLIILVLANYHDSMLGNTYTPVFGFEPLNVPPPQSEAPASPPLIQNRSITNVSETQQFRPLPPAANETELPLAEENELPLAEETQPPLAEETQPPLGQETQPPLGQETQTQPPLGQETPQFRPSPQIRPPFPQGQQPAIMSGPPIGFKSSGTINSLILVPQTKWIATGTWNMNVNNGNLSGFGTNMSWYDEKGGATHTHEFLNFRPNPQYMVIKKQPDNNILIRGLMDVGTNQKVVWKDVPTIINIKGQNTITISVDDRATNNHFASQPILGVVRSYVPCSDVPGPAMEIMAPCT